jgi:hypothetical protein
MRCGKFVEPRKRTKETEHKCLEGFANETNIKVEDEVTKVWRTLPATFCTLEQFAVALSSIFSSTYTCESLFSAMNYVKSDFRNRLIDESRVAHVNLSKTNYESDITTLTAKIQQQTSH